MPASLAPFFNSQFFTDAGAVAAGYKLATYITGTSTPKATYTDQGGLTANANPITLDAAGRCNLWLAGDGSEYAFELLTPALALVERWDDVAGVPIPDATEFVPLAGGVTMTGLVELSGPATSDLNPVTLGQLDDELAAALVVSNAAIASALPVGTVLMWVTGSIPTGYLALEGGNVSRTTYATLFALWGTAFGVGDGSTTFGLPDTRAYFMRGWDNGRGVDSGRAIATFQADAVQNITGEFTAICGGGITTSGAFENDGDSINHITATVAGTDNGISFDASRVARTAAETRPLNFAVRFIVRALAS
jgi:microcystin-dependent protein